MRKKHHLSILTSFLICIFILQYSYSQTNETTAEDTDKSVKININKWLVLPPQKLAPPLFDDIPNINKKIFSDADYLKSNQFSFAGHYPEVDSQFTEIEGNKLKWRAIASDKDGEIPYIDGQPGMDNNADTLRSTVVYLATYLRTERWLTAGLEISGSMMMKAWLDGKEVGTKTAVESDGKSGKLKKSLKLERGTHLLLVKLVIPPGTATKSDLSAALTLKSPFSTGDLEVTLSPKNRKNIYHMLDGIKVSDISLSYDGKYYAVSYRQSLQSGDQSESWTEIRRIKDKSLIHSYNYSRVSQISWLPNSSRISYVAPQGDKSCMFVYDIEKGTVTMIMKDLERFGSYRWSPDESFVIFSGREEPEEKPGVMRHILGMPDRQPGWRNRTFLYRYDITSGMTTRLTWGNLSTILNDISPDGKRILFSQHYPDLTERPYSKQNLFVMDLATFKTDTILFNESWDVSASFSPDGKSLLATGGPESFNGTGLNIPEGLIPHNSDIQVYIYDLQTKAVRSITRAFNPSVSSVFWHPVDKHIYMTVIEEDYRNLYRYDLTKDRFTRIITGVDYVTSVDFAGRGTLAVFSGNLANSWSAWQLIDLKTLKVSTFEDVEAATYRNVEFGEVKNWDFTASSGIIIKGRVYYPPGFDTAKTYPVIVYYYGGINPVGRTFAGRYPFNLWAGNDYLVYVLQPSGAVGFGQEFSAAHVNNWGFTVADEIIEGTKKFLDAHPFADRTKVGCAGASYGGFMTMLLLTRTDIFATAISHAGISSISSYWGEGYWGYAYSAGASAFSFPWNNRELYVGQSPLFYADKITTPLLLITGDEDTNVPPGESIQMYTALKLLGRPVELVLVKGENHHIITYSKRIMWHNTIMAWWDKYLKDQPEWWKEQYPDGTE